MIIVVIFIINIIPQNYEQFLCLAYLLYATLIFQEALTAQLRNREEKLIISYTFNDSILQ